jgi:hypothetical protein
MQLVELDRLLEVLETEIDLFLWSGRQIAKA